MTHNTNKNVNTQILSSIALANGAICEVALLGTDYAQAISDMHNQTIATLADNEKTYMLDKSLDYFAKHLNRGEGNAILGILDGDKVIAQSMILHPTSDNMNTNMTDMPNEPDPLMSSVMQAVSVDSTYRGQKLMEIMIDHWVDHAQTHGRTHLLAEVQVENVASYANFLKRGMNIVSIGQDPDDGVNLYNAHETVANMKTKRLTDVFNFHANKPMIKTPIQDLETQKTMLNEGFIITARDKANNSLIILKP
jgi:ribosomal protein S18 acetylase RimI-like enzyme